MAKILQMKFDFSVQARELDKYEHFFQQLQQCFRFSSGVYCILPTIPLKMFKSTLVICLDETLKKSDELYQID